MAEKEDAYIKKQEAEKKRRANALAKRKATQMTAQKDKEDRQKEAEKK